MKKQTEPTSKSWNFDLGLALVIGAATFQAYQFGRALNVYDPVGWSIKGVNIGGLFLGAIVNVIVVLASTRLPLLMAAALKPTGKTDKKTKDKNERRMQKAGMQARFAQGAFFFLMALSPLLIAPALYILWTALALPRMLIVFLSIGWASAPDLAIALGGFVAGKSLVQLGVAPAAKSARSASDSAPKSVGRASDSAKSATDSVGVRRTYPRKCEHCASDSPFAEIKSPNAIGGHMKKHHPELCKSKANAQFEAMLKSAELAK